MAANPSKVVLIGEAGEQEEDVSLLDILDHVLNAGVVVQGSIVISLAGVDLVYLGLNAVLTSVETAIKYIDEPAANKQLRRGKPRG
jgi:hypothetical protein